MARLVVIPFCADERDDLAPDLEHVAAHAGLTREATLALFTGAEYRVAFLGFSPGFAYLDGLPAPLRVPRLPSPRPRVEPGSVAIAGERAGVYPSATPGGWRVLGRTPLAMFDAWRDEPALLRAGDHVRFVRIGREEFQRRTQEEVLASDARRAAAVSRDGAGVPALRVVHPGTLSTVQDLGRPGHEGLGVPVGGACDALSLIVANRLVGNADHAACVECALGGLHVEALRETAVALAGARVAAVVTSPSGAMHELPVLGAVTLRAGDRLRLGVPAPGAGCRVYLALAGGVAVPRVLGSRSTLLSAGFGGLDGCPLRAGDELPAGEAIGAPAPATPALRASLAMALSRRVLRAVPEPGAPAGLVRTFFGDGDGALYRAAPRSDRTGLRLQPLTTAADSAAPDEPRSTPPAAPRADLPSRPAGVGAVQLPSADEAIALLADAPPTGGYEIVARVAPVDLPALAQVRPGEIVRFEAISADSAASLDRERRAWLDALLPPRESLSP